jgi:anti-anti-sigma factor
VSRETDSISREEYPDLGILLLSVKQALPGTAASTLSDHVAEILAADWKKIVIDLTAVSHISSTGLGMLLLIADTVKAANASMACVQSTSTQVNLVLRNLGLANVIPLVDTLADAFEVLTD